MEAAHESRVLAAINKKLWRELGLPGPEPELLPFLPMLVMAWSEGHLIEGQADTIAARSAALPTHLREWVTERLEAWPGPYFRIEVAHLLAFMRTVWPGEEDEAGLDWAERSEAWADELLVRAGWLRRLFGGLKAEKADLAAIRAVLDDGDILASDQLWALAREADDAPRRVVAIIDAHDQLNQLIGIVLRQEGETISVASFVPIVRDDDLETRAVAQLLASTGHLPEPERWILLYDLVCARGRSPTEHQRTELRSELWEHAGLRCQEVSTFELAWLEDGLAMDAHWVSWTPGQIEELHIDWDEVRRLQAPGTFRADRGEVTVDLLPDPAPGPNGMGFRVLVIKSERGDELRLATPIVLREPATADTVAWIARFLPAMCDPQTQLVLDETGRRWVAEVHSQLPLRPADVHEPLPPGRALLVPPWVWFRAANALGAGFYGRRRKDRKRGRGALDRENAEASR